MTDGQTISFLDAIFVKPDEPVRLSVEPVVARSRPRASTALTRHEETQHVQPNFPSG